MSLKNQQRTNFDVFLRKNAHFILKSNYIVF